MAGAIDKAIAVLAGRQHGYVNRAQLLGLGLTPQAIRWRVQTGWLIPVYAGVYAVGYVRRTPVARAHAAVLACGEKAALSHGSAASLWGFSKHWDEPFEVTVPALRARKGITVHRSRTLTRRDLTRQDGIPVTSPARTVLDTAPRLTGKRLSRFVNGALRTPYLHVPDLADVLNRNPNHPGAKRILPFVQAPDELAARGRLPGVRQAIRLADPGDQHLPARLRDRRAVPPRAGDRRGRRR